MSHTRAQASSRTWSPPRSLLLLLLLALGLLSLQASRGTTAFFTDTVSSSGNTFTAGDLAILLNDTGSPGTGTVSFTDTLAKPTSVGYAFLKVATGAGSVNANVTSTIKRTRVSADATRDDAMDGRLQFALKEVTGVTASSGCAAAWATGTTVALTNPDNTGLSATSNRATLTPLTASAFMPSVAYTGAQTRTYCLQAAWVNATDNKDNLAKNGANTYDLTFTATQS